MDHYVEFIKRMDVETIEDATGFLLDLVLFEESERNQNAAKNALYDLSDFFSRNGPDGKLKSGILKAAIDQLPVNED